MKNRFRIWDKTDEVMIYPENYTLSIKSDWPSVMTIGLHGITVSCDSDSFRGNEIKLWNVDHNKFAMRSSGLDDGDGKEIWAGDLRALRGNIYKVVDDGWRMRFERNLVEFGNNDEINLDEDSAYESTLIGNIYQNHKLLINNQ